MEQLLPYQQQSIYEGSLGKVQRKELYRLWKKKKAEKEPIARAPAEEKAAEQSLSKRAIQ